MRKGPLDEVGKDHYEEIDYDLYAGNPARKLAAGLNVSEGGRRY